MKYIFKPKGVCSREIIIDLDPDDTILDISIIGGCNGNLKGICNLIRNKKAQEIIPLLKGTTCNFKNTSCPDQIAIALQEAIEKNKK